MIPFPRKERRRTISLNFKDAHQRGKSLLNIHNRQRSSSQKNEANLKRCLTQESPYFPLIPLLCQAMRSTLNAPLKRSHFIQCWNILCQNKHKPHPQIIISSAGSLPAAFSCMNKHNHSLLSQQIHIRCLLEWERGSGIASCLQAKKSAKVLFGNVTREKDDALFLLRWRKTSWVVTTGQLSTPTHSFVGSNQPLDPGPTSKWLQGKLWSPVLVNYANPRNW